MRAFIAEAEERNREENRKRLFFGTGGLAFVLMTGFGAAPLGLIPLLPLVLLLFGMQAAFSQLKSRFIDGSKVPNIWREHVVSTARQVSIGVWPGSLFATLVFAIPYHAAWLQWAARMAAQVAVEYQKHGMIQDQSEALARAAQVEPLESLIVEISYATVLGAFTLGFLTLLFGQTQMPNLRAVLSPAPSIVNVMVGSIFGGVLSGLFVGPIVTLYFGQLARPELTPMYFLPGAILGSAILAFSIVNELERLSLRRALTGSLGVVVALAIGAGAAATMFGTLLFFGATQAVIAWMESNAQSNFVLAAGGAIYGIPVGIVLGIVIGVAVLLTERWSGKLIFDAAGL